MQIFVSENAVFCYYSPKSSGRASFRRVHRAKTIKQLKLPESQARSNAYLLTPWSRVLLEKLTGSAANQEIPRIFGTRRFLTVPTSARHLSLS